MCPGKESRGQPGASVAVLRRGIAHNTHFLFGCIFNHPLGAYGTGTTEEGNVEWEHMHRSINLIFKGLLRK